MERVRPQTVDELVFAYCPTYVYGDPKFSSLLDKIKLGGRIVVYGPPLESKINISKVAPATIVIFKSLLENALKKSRIHFDVIVNSSQPYVSLVRRSG